MASAKMLTLREGFGPFLDNYIVILAGRYGAPITCESFPVEYAEAWGRVAAAVQSAMRSPQTDDERLQLALVEPSMFTAQVCHHRASYLLWRARRVAGNRPSGFDITKHSIGRQIEEIYQDAKGRLPVITAGDDDDDDDDDETGGEVHIFEAKSAEQLARDKRIGEAEDDLMRRIQELQVEFFDKHRKWVDVPLTTSPSVTPQKGSRRIAVNGGAIADNEEKTERGANFCIENINCKLLTDVTPEDLAVVFDALDISEHKAKFRRTTGQVLKTLNRVELVERFDKDVEAADLLWAWIEERRTSAPTSKSSTPKKSGAENAAARQQVTAMLDMFRKIGGAPQAPQPTTQYLDPLANLKRAMNPNRPLRPSQQDYEQEEALAALGDDGQDPQGIETVFSRESGRPAAAAAAAASSHENKNTSLDPRQHGNAPAATKSASSAPQQPPSVSAASSARAQRWQVVEYEDDDEDEDEE